MAPSRSSGWCFVPGCNHIRKLIPEKLFFPVPQGEMRKKWCDAARRSLSSVSSNEWCCEDHFTLEDDVQDWMRYKVLKEAGLKTFRLRLKPDAVPHIFACQPGRRGARAKPQQKSAVQKQRAEIIEHLLTEIKEAEPTLYLGQEADFLDPLEIQFVTTEVKEQPTNFIPEQLAESHLAGFDYQDSLWAPYCDVELQEEINAVPAGLPQGISQEQITISADLNDGTYFVVQMDPSDADPIQAQSGDRISAQDDSIQENIKLELPTDLQSQDQRTHARKRKQTLKPRGSLAKILEIESS